MLFSSSAAAGLLHGSAGGISRGGLLHIPSADFLAAHRCPSSCGEAQFFYPFGIGRGCFRQGFELTCDHTTHPPKLLLGNSTSSTIHLTYAYPDDQSIGFFGFNATMGRGVDTYNVSMSWETPDEGVFISSNNNLYVVGCNVDAFMFGDNMTDLIGFCTSVCTDDRETMERVNFDGYSCTGFACCVIDWLGDLPAFTLKLVRRNVTTGVKLDQGLSNVKVLLANHYVFTMADLYTSWVNISNVNDVAIEIAITDQPNCERARANKDTYACNDESNCSNLPSGRGYNCKCPNYWQGNPYVVDGSIQGPYLFAAVLLLLVLLNCSIYTFLYLNANDEILL
jgi:hypothetical protein